MATRTEIKPGHPVWADVIAPDVREAADFYQHLFGWEYEVGGSELGFYRTALEAGRKVAGIGDAYSPDAHMAWRVYFATPDVVRTVARANELGAAVVMEPEEIPQQGMVAMVSAPGGATFGLWQAFHHPGFELKSEHGAYTWCEAGVSNVQAATAFYCALFGFGSSASADGKHQVLSLDGEKLAGVSGRRDDQEADEWTVYFQVHDTDAAVAAVQAGGGSVLFGPSDQAEGRVAVFSDQAGARFGVLNP